MKKWTPVLLGLMIANPVSAHYKPFSGFYGGGNIGLIQSNVHNDQDVVATFPNVFNFIASSDSKITDTALTGGITLGYSSLICSGWVLGIEGRANFQNLNTSNHASMSESISMVQAQACPSIKIDQDFALVGKLGFTHCYKFLMYGLVGVDWAKTRLSIDAFFEQTFGVPISGVLEESCSKYESGLMLGLGMEYYLTKCATIGLEYNYVNYGSLNNTLSGQLIADGFPLLDSVITANSGVKVQTNKFLFKFNYYFI